MFLQVLCKSHPVEFASYLHYCHSLTFDQRPDYGFLKRLFRDLFAREGIGEEILAIKSILVGNYSHCLVMVPPKWVPIRENWGTILPFNIFT